MSKSKTAEVSNASALPLIPMKLVPMITDAHYAMRKFIGQLKSDIEELNKLIFNYNQTEGKAQQIAMLQQVYRYKQLIENKYSDEEISLCLNYRIEIHHNLFLEMQKQFAILGIDSMHNILKISPMVSTAVVRSPDSFPEILDNMAPAKASRMLEILVNGSKFNKSDFESLYVDNEPGYTEFRRFIENNDFMFLGGNNSKNFKISPKDGSPPYVLKVDNRMGMPKSAEAHLREHSLKDVFTPVAVDRQVTGTLQGETITRTLIITDFCIAGDVESHSKAHRTDHKALLESALDIYTQMGTILIGITRDGCAFPDMKNSNWLLDDKGTLRLADTKSFVLIEENGQLNKVKNAEKWYTFASTRYMNPPENYKDSFSADNMHSFMLGKNIYRYLTRCDSQYLIDKDNGESYNFKAPVFNTPEGRELKTLIISMIKPNPAERISMNDALHALKGLSSRVELQNRANETLQCNTLLETIKTNSSDDTFIRQKRDALANTGTAKEIMAIRQVLEQTAECQAVLKELEKGLFKDDTLMQKYIQEKGREILQAGTLEDLKNIKDKLVIIQKDPATQAIRDIIQNFRNNETWYSVGMSAKADRISAAMAQVPVEERGNFMSGGSDKSRQVRVALASHRHFGKREETFLREGTEEVDESKAANSFQDFKTRFLAEKNKIKADVSYEKDIKPPTPNFNR